MKILRFFSGLLMLIFLSACDDRVVVNDLNQSQATEILLALHQSGIDAEGVTQTQGRKTSYQVTVEKDNLGRSLEILQSYGLLPKARENIAELTQGEGFMPPSPELSQVRLGYALSRQVEELLLALPNVVEVRAVVRLNPAPSVFSEGNADRYNGASVVIRYVSHGSDTPFSVEKVQQLVSHAVSGLRAEDVHVETSAIALPPAGSLSQALTQLSPYFPTFHVTVAEKEKALRQLGAVLLLAITFAGVIGYFLCLRRVRGKFIGQTVRAENLLERASENPSGGKLPERIDPERIDIV